MFNFINKHCDILQYPIVSPAFYKKSLLFFYNFPSIA